MRVDRLDHKFTSNALELRMTFWVIHSHNALSPPRLFDGSSLHQEYSSKSIFIHYICSKGIPIWGLDKGKRRIVMIFMELCPSVTLQATGSLDWSAYYGLRISHLIPEKGVNPSSLEMHSVVCHISRIPLCWVFGIRGECW